MAKPKPKGSPKRTPSPPTVAKARASKSRVLKAPAAVKPAGARGEGVKSAVAKPRTVKRHAAEVAPLQQADRLDRLWAAIQQVREGGRESPRTARLLASGAPKLAQKLVEEAAEVAIEAVRGDRAALINESVDLLYNLAALWNGLGVEPSVIWAEMDRREAALGMAEKLPKTEDI